MRKKRMKIGNCYIFAQLVIVWWHNFVKMLWWSENFPLEIFCDRQSKATTRSSLWDSKHLLINSSDEVIQCIWLIWKAVLRLKAIPRRVGINYYVPHQVGLNVKDEMTNTTTNTRLYYVDFIWCYWRHLTKWEITLIRISFINV